MDRRRYLIGAASLLGAGCVARPTASGDSTTSPTQGDQTPVRYDVSDESGSPVEFESGAELRECAWDSSIETSYGTGAAVGIIENISSTRTARIRVSANFYDSSDSVIAEFWDAVEFIWAGEWYQFVLPPRDVAPDTVSEFSLSVDVRDQLLTQRTRDLVSAGEHNWDPSAEPPGVSGRLENTSDQTLSRVYPHVNFLRGDQILASRRDGVSDLGSGESFEWFVPYSRDDVDAVEDYRVTTRVQPSE